MRDRVEDDSVDSALVGGGYTLYRRNRPSASGLDPEAVHEALKRDHEARADPLPVAGDD